MRTLYPGAALAFAAAGCLLASACGKDAPTEPVTEENVVGTWYTKQIDAASGMTVMLYLDCRADGTARIGLMNGNLPVELMNVNYAVAGGMFSFDVPPVDTATQNTLQIMFAAEMQGIFAADRAYFQRGNLVFVEPGKTYSFSPTMPGVTGGRITGTVSVTNGSFGNGGVVVAAVELSSGNLAGTFLSGTGPYTLWGLQTGYNWFVVAVYIPKSHALDWADHDVTEFASDVVSPLVVQGNQTVSGVNFTLDLSTGLPASRASDRDIVARALRAVLRW